MNLRELRDAVETSDMEREAKAEIDEILTIYRQSHIDTCLMCGKESKKSFMSEIKLNKDEKILEIPLDFLPDFKKDIEGSLREVAGKSKLKINGRSKRNERKENMDKEITGDEFHEILKKIIGEKVSVDDLLSIPDVYECLCEEYNNEVLEVWEQGVQDDEHLFEFTLTERTSGKCFSMNHLIKAKSDEDARQKVKKFCENWYEDDSTYRFDEVTQAHCFDCDLVCLTVEDLRETTKKEWLNQIYATSLIS
jgi:hypothetical protein